MMQTTNYTEQNNFFYCPMKKANVVWILAPYKDTFYKTRISYTFWLKLNGLGLMSIHPYKSAGNKTRFMVKVRGYKQMDIARFTKETPHGLQCDHIDRHTWNNVDTNLRNVEPYVNMANRSNSVSVQSGHIGVTHFPLSNKWQVKVRKPNGTQKHVGLFPFDKIEDAVKKQKQVQLGFNFDGLEMELKALYKNNGRRMGKQSKQFWNTLIERSNELKGGLK
jgi:hypothetical protein